MIDRHCWNCKHTWTRRDRQPCKKCLRNFMTFPAMPQNKCLDNWEPGTEFTEKPSASG